MVKGEFQSEIAVILRLLLYVMNISQRIHSLTHRFRGVKGFSSCHKHYNEHFLLMFLSNIFKCRILFAIREKEKGVTDY